MDPLTLGLGIGAARTGLNIFGAIAGNNAEKQQYLNDRGEQQANSVYAGWKATVEQAMAGANQDQNYWRETVQHNQDLAYTRSQRNVDLVRSINQAETVRQTRESAGSQFILSSEGIQQRLAEQAMADAVALQQYTVAALRNRASIRANPQAGASIDRLMNDFVRQEGDYRTITAINDGLRNRQYRREQAGAVAQYLSAYNSQAFYEAQPYLEPMAPFVPLPSLLMPAAPTSTGAEPSRSAGALRIGTSILEGATSTMGAINSFRGMASSGKGNPLAG
jgi:hypothetical protein